MPHGVRLNESKTKIVQDCRSVIAKKSVITGDWFSQMSVSFAGNFAAAVIASYRKSKS